MATRRDHLARLGLAGLGFSTAGAALGLGATTAPAHGAGQDDGPPVDAFPLTARRTELTLPPLPSLGTPYICLLDLFDPDGAQVGTATADARVTTVTLDGPVVLAMVVLQLADGEIHYQRRMDRFGEFPRTAIGAVLGGTGAYLDARGDVSITWPDEEQIDLVVRLVRPQG